MTQAEHAISVTFFYIAQTLTTANICRTTADGLVLSFAFADFIQKNVLYHVLDLDGNFAFVSSLTSVT